MSIAQWGVFPDGFPFETADFTYKFYTSNLDLKLNCGFKSSSCVCNQPIVSTDNVAKHSVERPWQVSEMVSCRGNM